MNEDFVLRLWVRNRPEPIQSLFTKTDALVVIAEMHPESIAKMFGRTDLPPSALEASRDLLRVAAVAAIADRHRREGDDFNISYLGGVATAVRSTDLDKIELVDVEALSAPERKPYKASSAGFDTKRLAGEG